MPTPLPQVPRHRIGHILRMVSAAVFCVSFAATCYLSLLVPAFGPPSVSATRPVLLVCAGGLCLVTAPIGWRVLASLFTGRPIVATPFFRASPLMLGLAFALAALYFFLAPALYATQGTQTLPIGTALALQALLAVVNLLLLCTLLAAPLVLLLHLLKWSGGWLWRRMSAR